MAKKSRRLRQAPGASAESGGTEVGSGRSVEDAALGFAEDLGRFLGSTQKRAEQWLGQRKNLAEQLTQIRDAANSYLQQLTGADVAVLRRARRGRPPGSVNKAAAVGAEPVGRKRKRRAGMSAAQRKAVGERMKKYWAARRKAEKKG